MKTIHLYLVSFLSATAFGHGQTISNPWSGILGDRGNMAAFAFQANAGLFPDSISPIGALDGVPEIYLDRLTLTRPNDTTTPVFGTGPFQITSSSTLIFVDVYLNYSGGVFSDYLGSSVTGVAWDSTLAGVAYSFDFSNIILSVDQKYWFVFSEDAAEGEVSQFRAQLNTTGDNATPGPGKGYLVGDTVQSVTSGGVPQDWAFAYVVDFTPVPEPSTMALGLFGPILLLLRFGLGRRRV